MGRTPKKIKFTKPKGMGLDVTEYDIKGLYGNKAGKKGNFKMVVLPDIHYPDFDPVAIKVLLEYLKDYKPDGLLFLGDLWEMDAVTRWDRESNDVDKALTEFEGCIKWLKKGILKAAGPQCKTKIFLMGNHEDWFRQYVDDMRSFSPDKIKLLERMYGSARFEDLCGLKDIGFDVHPYITEHNACHMIKIGHAHFTHGNIAGMNPAKKLFMQVLANVYQGHTERIDTYIHKSIRGLLEAMCLGTLRDPSKVTFNKGRLLGWNHSFSTFEFMDDGYFSRATHLILNGRISVNGKTYGAK